MVPKNGPVGTTTPGATVAVFAWRAMGITQAGDAAHVALAPRLASEREC
jgi:hypothetical protein